MFFTVTVALARPTPAESRILPRIAPSAVWAEATRGNQSKTRLPSKRTRARLRHINQDMRRGQEEWECRGAPMHTCQGVDVPAGIYRPAPETSMAVTSSRTNENAKVCLA